MFAESKRDFVREIPPDLCPECLKVFDGLIAQAKEVG
jgi:hypothetical protein